MAPARISRQDRGIRGGVWSLVVGLPAACWLATLTLVIRSRVEYSTWPTYGTPDPSVFGGHYAATIWFYLLSIAVVATALVATPLVRLAGIIDLSWLPVLIGAGLLLGYIMFMNADIAGISNWLGD